jgi:uncharacterized protein (DUF1330 family)
MSTESCTLVASASPNPENAADMQSYMQQVTPLLMGLEGGPPRRMKVSEVVNGDATAIVMMMDFPSREALSALFASDAYQALVPIRDRGFKSMDIWICQPM